MKLKEISDQTLALARQRLTLLCYILTSSVISPTVENETIYVPGHFCVLFWWREGVVLDVEGWERGLEPQKGGTPSSWGAGGSGDHGESSEGRDHRSVGGEEGHCRSGEVGSPDRI